MRYESYMDNGIKRIRAVFFPAAEFRGANKEIPRSPVNELVTSSGWNRKREGILKLAKFVRRGEIPWRLEGEESVEVRAFISGMMEDFVKKTDEERKQFK